MTGETDLKKERERERERERISKIISKAQCTRVFSFVTRQTLTAFCESC